ncbi:hypothetical protein SRABI106_03242 [Rahnella aquatilis]|nr:hypothetical protein SRABI106_03242 [Rahnella aquatilis]
MNRSHAWDQIEFFQLSGRERAVIDSFDKGNFVTRFQYAGARRCGSRLRLQNNAHFAAEQPALIILIADFQPGFRISTLQLAVSRRNLFIHMLFDQLARIPRDACPGRAKDYNDAYSD